MPYLSSNPPIADISILSVQSSFRHIWHNVCFLLMLNGEVRVEVDGHAPYLNGHGIMLVEADTPYTVSGNGSNLVMTIRMDYDNVRTNLQIMAGSEPHKAMGIFRYPDQIEYRADKPRRNSSDMTTNAINTYNIVLYNYAHFNDLYCLSNGGGATCGTMSIPTGRCAIRPVRTVPWS